MLKDILKKAAAAVAMVPGLPVKPLTRDPFYNDLERHAEVNDATRGGLPRWLGPRRRGWLR